VRVHERLNRRQHLFGAERRQPADGMERQLSRFNGEDAVRHERVEVDVQVEGATESLNHHDRAAATVLDAVVVRPIAQHPKDAADQYAGDGPA
jgi:hypothetical protein